MIWLKVFGQAFILISLTLVTFFAALVVVVMASHDSISLELATLLLIVIASAAIATFQAIGDWLASWY